ncbi:MAG: divalent-cation tolerance protein CutA, partial [Rhodospirillales bacterium]
LGEIESVYRWKGEVCQDREVALIVKTTDRLVEKVVARIKELHSYDCPCVISIPITGGNPDFLDWIVSETE